MWGIFRDFSKSTPDFWAGAISRKYVSCRHRVTWSVCEKNSVIIASMDVYLKKLPVVDSRHLIQVYSYCQWLGVRTTESVSRGCQSMESRREGWKITLKTSFHLQKRGFSQSQATKAKDILEVWHRQIH